MDSDSGKALIEALQENETLIQLDIEGNPKVDLHDVRTI